MNRRPANFAAALPWYMISVVALCLFLVSAAVHGTGGGGSSGWYNSGSSYDSGSDSGSWFDSGSSSSGSSDSGSWDSGGSDSGSWDSGGGDSGGSDSGSW